MDFFESCVKFGNIKKINGVSFRKVTNQRRHIRSNFSWMNSLDLTDFIGVFLIFSDHDIIFIIINRQSVF